MLRVSGIGRGVYIVGDELAEVEVAERAQEHPLLRVVPVQSQEFRLHVRKVYIIKMKLNTFNANIIEEHPLLRVVPVKS